MLLVVLTECLGSVQTLIMDDQTDDIHHLGSVVYMWKLYETVNILGCCNLFINYTSIIRYLCFGCLVFRAATGPIIRGTWSITGSSPWTPRMMLLIWITACIRLILWLFQRLHQVSQPVIVWVCNENAPSAKHVNMSPFQSMGYKAHVFINIHEPKVCGDDHMNQRHDCLFSCWEKLSVDIPL